MTFATSYRTGIQRQRGFWLRCFLGAACAVFVLCWAACGALHAEVGGASPLRLTHVEGYVTNSAGTPVVNAEVTLVQDDRVIYRTRTDGEGAFRFDQVRGRYWFRVARTEYAPAAREVVVTDEIVTRLKRNKLYVIAGPGACMDECSSFYTSKHQFEQAIRKRSGH